MGIINPKIKYNFRQIEKGLVAFVTDFEKKVQYLFTDAPCFVLQTGDTSYYLNSKFEEVKDKTIYEKIPRFTIMFSGFETPTDTNTNRFNRWTPFSFEDNNYTCTFRRCQLNVSVVVTAVSSNFIMALEMFMAMMTIINQENAFSYEFSGAKFDGKFYIDQSQELEFPEMDFGSTRKYNQKLNMGIELHIYVPDTASILNIVDYNLETKINLTEKTPEGNIRGEHLLDPSV